MANYEIISVINLSLILNNIVYTSQIVIQMKILINNIGIIRLINNTNQFLLLSESLYRTLLNQTIDYIGINNIKYFPLIYTLFHYILQSNLIGKIPYNSTITVEIIITILQAFSLLIGILIIGLLNHNKYLQAIFIPTGTPLNLIPLMKILEIQAYITRTLSQGQRLAVNMITGHIQAKILINFIYIASIKGIALYILIQPLLQQTAFQSLELLIAYLQAYIFTFITLLTLKDIIN